MRALNELHLKYIDDFTLADAIDLPSKLTNLDVRPRPDPFYAQTGLTLATENSKVYEQLKKTEDYARENDMMINHKKTNLMIFNPYHSKDFLPNFKLGKHELQIVEKMRFLGVNIRSDLKWHDNTENIVRKAYSKLWMLRRLNILGASEEDLVDIYCKQIRCHLEFAVPVWQGAITQHERTTLERVQRCAVRIILGDRYVTYKHALSVLKLEDLESRRVKLCLNFGLKAAKHVKHQKWLKPKNKTRSNQKYYTVFAEGSRFENSPLAYITYKTE